MVQNYLVAICDILGFKDLVMKNDVINVVNNSLSFLLKSLSHSINKNNFPEEQPNIDEFKKNKFLGVAWFSDTILIYTKEDTNDNCQKLLETIGWLMFENMNFSPTRLRVGISYGEAYINEIEGIFVGKPIVEAYLLEQSQEWSGGALTKKVEEKYGDYLSSLNPVQSWVIPYEVPLKHNISKKLLAINWTNGIHSFDNFYWSENNYVPSDEDKKNIPDIVTKWRNTKTFHEDVCYRCFPNLNNSNIIKPPGSF